MKRINLNNEQYAIFSPEKFRVKQITDTDKNQIVYLNKEKKSIQDTSEVLEQLNIEKENNTKYNEDIDNNIFAKKYILFFNENTSDFFHIFFSLIFQIPSAVYSSQQPRRRYPRRESAT